MISVQSKITIFIVLVVRSLCIISSERYRDPQEVMCTLILVDLSIQLDIVDIVFFILYELNDLTVVCAWATHRIT